MKLKCRHPIVLYYYLEYIINLIETLTYILHHLLQLLRILILILDE